MILLFEFRCKITAFFSYIQKSRVEKELFYLSPLYIVYFPIMLYVENAILNDLCTLYIVTLYIRGEVCGLSTFKPHRDVTGTESGGKAGRIVNRAYAGIGIGGVEGLIEEDDTVVAVEHQITSMDCAGLVCSGGKRGTEVMVFLIAVQFVHRHGKGQKGSKGFAGFGICERSAKGL